MVATLVKATPPGAPLMSEEEKRRIAQVALNAAQAAVAGETNVAAPDTLAGILYQTWLSTFEATLGRENARAGFAVGVVKLTDPEILAELQTTAETTSRGIIRTFEKDLLSFVHKLPAGTDPADVPRLVAEWNLQRDTWKIPQIAITETAKARGRAQKEFVKRTGAKGTANFGSSLQCNLCQSIASGNPYDLKDSIVGEIPHPHCLDSWSIHYATAAAPWWGA